MCSSNGVGWSYGSFNNGQFSVAASSKSETTYIYSKHFELKANQIYTLSFESKEDNTSLNGRDMFILSDNYSTNNAILSTSFDMGSDWHKVVWTFTTTAAFSGVTDLRLRIDHNGSSDGSFATIYARSIKLEIGNKATDGSPAPEDIDAASQGYANSALAGAKQYSDAQIKVQSDSITEAVGKVDTFNGRMNTAEEKLTPTAINLVVKSQTEAIAAPASNLICDIFFFCSA